MASWVPVLTSITKFPRSVMSPPPTTDVVARLHAFYLEKAVRGENQLPALQQPPPQSVVDTLVRLDIDFDRLPVALQHALMWEAGYATTADGRVVAFRTHCGLSTADALSRSTEARPMCAVQSPEESATDLAWLTFSNESPLPTVTYATSGASRSLELGALSPCTTATVQDNYDQSFCIPSPGSTLHSWISLYVATTATPAAKSRRTTSTSDRATGTQPALTASMATAANSTFASQPEPDLSSDFTSMLYAFRAAGASLPHIQVSTGVPLDVKTRLDASHQSFASLSGLLQRAVLWDTGYAIVRRQESSTIVDVVPVYVKCGLRMADIAPDRAYFESTGCSVQDCSLTNSTATEEPIYSWRALDCRLNAAGSKLLAVTRCAVPASTDLLNIPHADSTTVWAVGTIAASEQAAVPRLRLQQHPFSTPANKWYAIRFAASEVSLGTCPTEPSFIIPCDTVDQPSLQQEWCRPVQSDLILTWLRQEQHQVMALATLILMAGAILLALALDLFVDRRPRLLVTGQVGVSIPSLTSTFFDGRDNDAPEEPQELSVRAAESVRSDH